MFPFITNETVVIYPIAAVPYRSIHTGGKDHFKALQVQEVLIPQGEPKFPGRKYIVDVFVSRAEMRRQSFLIT